MGRRKGREEVVVEQGMGSATVCAEHLLGTLMAERRTEVGLVIVLAYRNLTPLCKCSVSGLQSLPAAGGDSRQC